MAFAIGAATMPGRSRRYLFAIVPPRNVSGDWIAPGQAGETSEIAVVRVQLRLMFDGEGRKVCIRD